jgi:glycine cleavage system H protein
MDGFTYTNIFETKGIEYIIIITFLVLIIPFWLILNKPGKVYELAVKTLGVLTDRVLKIPQGLFYSKNHTWTHLESSGAAKVGVNDLLLHITGPIELSGLKDPGQKITKGSILALITHDGKQLQIASPITGEIESVNDSLVKNPWVINDDPYEKGWIYKIKPDNWVAETNSYLLADNATNWMSNELARFKDFVAITMNKLSPETSKVILQEGGELLDNPLSSMPVEVWKDFQTQFLDQI